MNEKADTKTENKNQQVAEVKRAPAPAVIDVPW